MCWREGEAALLPSHATLWLGVTGWAGVMLGWGDAGLGHGAFCRLGLKGWQREHNVFHDRLKRDSMSPTFHRDDLCHFISSAQNWGSASLRRGCGGGRRGGGGGCASSSIPLPSYPRGCLHPGEGSTESPVKPLCH